MRLKNRSVFFMFFTALILLQSCGINSNLMFKQDKEERSEVNSSKIPLQPMQESKISPNDKISFILSANNGEEIIEGLTGISSENAASFGDLTYVVQSDGTIDLPILGKVAVVGLTIAECQDTLKHYFKSSYNDPFVQVKIENQRVIVFPGDGSSASVIQLENPNTTLMEVIAASGGIPARGKANTIKIIRKVNGKREIYIVDLSTIDGLKYSDMIIQSNDYIYIEPAAELAKEIVRDLAPILSLFTSALLIFGTINLLK